MLLFSSQRKDQLPFWGSWFHLWCFWEVMVKYLSRHFFWSTSRDVPRTGPKGRCSYRTWTRTTTEPRGSSSSLSPSWLHPWLLYCTIRLSIFLCALFVYAQTSMSALPTRARTAVPVWIRSTDLRACVQLGIQACCVRLVGVRERPVMFITRLSMLPDDFHQATAKV